MNLTVPYPLSANRYKSLRVIAGKGRKPFVQTYVTKEAEEYKAQVERACRAAGIREPILGRVGVAYTLYPHRPLDFAARMRKHGDAWQDTVQCIDLDNAQKVLFDALKGIAFEDDVWIREIRAYRAEPDSEGARVMVTIWPILTPAPQSILDLPVLARVADPLDV